MDDRTLEALRGLYDEHGKPLPIRSLAEVLEERGPMKLTPERLDELETLARMKTYARLEVDPDELLALISMARASVWRDRMSEIDLTLTADFQEMIELHKGQCNFYVNGVCSNTGCLKRGGWSGGAVDYSVATCLEKQTVEAIESLQAKNAELREALGAIEEDGTEEHNAAIRLRSEVARLRTALEKIAGTSVYNETETREDCRYFALTALQRGEGKE